MSHLLEPRPPDGTVTVTIGGGHRVIAYDCGDGGEVVVFKNSSHMPFYEEPDPYRACLLRFLEGLPRG